MAIGAITEHWGNDRHLLAGLQEITVPKITINTSERPTNTEVAQRQGIEVRWMAGVGHFGMMEDAQTFNRLLDEAVQKCLHARAPQEAQKPRVGLA